MNHTKNNFTNPRKKGGINNPRRVLIKTIWFQTGINVCKEANKYFNTVDKWNKAEGIFSTTKRLKEIYHVALNSFLLQPNPEYSFLKTTDGFPTVVIYLRKFRNSPKGIQAALSLLGYYRGIHLRQAPDFSSIIDEGQEVHKSVIKLITDEIPKDWKFSLQSLSPPEYQFRSKRGPNGQATLECLKDLQALEDEGLIPNLLEFLELQGTPGEDLAEDILELQSLKVNDFKQTPRSSRLALKFEGGGKTRVFAMVDYFSQCALSPLHNKIASILKKIPQDCTFNQEKGISDLKNWTLQSSENNSLDLSKATDRFPLILQKEVLKKLTGDSTFAELWSKLMSDRSFYYKTKSYKWRVGQPLGAYSSWPIFALTHHLTVMAAAKLAKEKTPSYYLLGDDIVIKGNSHSNMYRKLLSMLDVKVSLSKSLKGSSIEFAKRLFHKGKEVSPIPVKMIQSLIKDPLLVKEMLNQLCQRSSVPYRDLALRLVYFTSWLAVTLRYSEHKIEILITAPGKPGSGTEGPNGINPEGDLIWPVNTLGLLGVRNVIAATEYKYLVDEYSRLQRSSQSMKEEIDAMKLPGLDTGVRSIHPVYISLNLLKEKQRKGHRMIGKYWSKLTNTPNLSDIEMPNDLQFSVTSLTADHKERSKHEAKSILKAFYGSLKAHKKLSNAQAKIYSENSPHYPSTQQVLKLIGIQAAKVPTKP